MVNPSLMAVLGDDGVAGAFKEILLQVFGRMLERGAEADGADGGDGKQHALGHGAVQVLDVDGNQLDLRNSFIRRQMRT